MSLPPLTLMPESRLAAQGSNARRSTGPRTPQGKLRSRWNAFRHGQWASGLAWSDESLQHLGEDPEKFKKLREGLLAAQGPVADPLWVLQLEDLGAPLLAPAAPRTRLGAHDAPRAEFHADQQPPPRAHHAPGRPAPQASRQPRPLDRPQDPPAHAHARSRGAPTAGRAGLEPERQARRVRCPGRAVRGYARQPRFSAVPP